MDFRADDAARHCQEACKQLPLTAIGTERMREKACRLLRNSMVEAQHSLQTFKHNAKPWLVQIEQHIRESRDMQQFMHQDARLMGAFMYF